MPYSPDKPEDLPENVKKLSSTDQRRWINVFNSVYRRCRDNIVVGSTEEKRSRCEQRAFQQANGVVMKSASERTFADSDKDSPKTSVVDFLKRLRDQLRDSIDPEDFNIAVRQARSHAGGVAKARNRRDANDAKAESDDDTRNHDDASRKRDAKPGSVDSDDAKPGTKTDSTDSDVSKIADAKSGPKVEISIKAASEDPLNEFMDDYYVPSKYRGVLQKTDERVQYRDATTPQETCGNCQFFCRPMSCSVVVGVIAPDDTCNLSVPMNVAASESFHEPDDDEPCPDCGKVHARDEEPAEASERRGANFDPDLKLFLELEEYAEVPDWIPFLPTPGTYKHPRFGQVVVDQKRVDRFMENFKGEVYQKHIPIDLEHQLKTSGAAGYIRELKQASDGSVDARIEWTDLGRGAIERDRVKYFSPEWYDRWTHPLSDKTYHDVVTGGALTTRPFFKDSNLRPLVASEGELYVSRSTGELSDDDWEDELETFSESPQSFHSAKVSHDHSGGRGKSGSGSSSSKSKSKSKSVGSADTPLSSSQGHQAFSQLSRGAKVNLTVHNEITRQNTTRDHTYVEPLARGGYRLRTNGRNVTVKEEGGKLTYSMSGTSRGMGPISHVRVIEPTSGTFQGSEGDDEMGMTEDEAKRFDELFTSVGELNTRVEATEKERDSALEQLKTANEQLSRLTTADQIRRYTQLSEGWPGEAASNIATLQTYAKTYGEESEEFLGFVKTMSETAKKIQQSSLFHEVGTSRHSASQPSVSSTFGEIDERARKLMANQPGLSVEAARVQVFSESPELYDQYEAERVKKVKSLING